MPRPVPCLPCQSQESSEHPSPCPEDPSRPQGGGPGQLCSSCAARLQLACVGEGTTGEGPSPTLIFPSMSAETLGWAGPRGCPHCEPQTRPPAPPHTLRSGSPGGETGRAHTSHKAAGTSSSLAGARQCPSPGPTWSPSSGARPPYPSQGRRSGALLLGRVPPQPKGALQGEGRVPLEQLLPALPGRKSPGDPYLLWKLFSKARAPHKEGSPQQTGLTNPHHSQETWGLACRCQLPGISDTWNLPTGVRESE